MGLDWQGTKFLAEIRRAGVDFARTVTIGRQDRHVSMPKVRQLLEANGLPHTLTNDDMQAGTGHGDAVFMQLGAQTVDSIDASDYEGATIVADMNQPIPAELHEKYDLVYDGGTLEHVFNVRQAFSNAMSLPKVGGSLIIHTMANNWFGHGFYQFSPELFYRVLSPDNGYQIVRAVAHESFEQAQWYEIPDPALVRSRIELSNSWHGIMLLIHAKRVAAVPLLVKTPQQSDYSSTWHASHESESSAALEAATVDATNGAADGPHGFTSRMIASLKARLPWVLRLKHTLLSRYPAVPRLVNARLHRRDRQRFSATAQPEKFRPVK
jgi:hypothetical protein